jgi:hypothetical protein
MFVTVKNNTMSMLQRMTYYIKHIWTLLKRNKSENLYLIRVCRFSNAQSLQFYILIGLDSYLNKRWSVEGSCEYGNELLGSGNFLKTN